MNKRLFMIFLLTVMALFVVVACSDYQRSKICGTHAETYTNSVKGCDQINNCRCLHESWGGLGACDSCECTKQVSDC